MQKEFSFCLFFVLLSFGLLSQNKMIYQNTEKIEIVFSYKDNPTTEQNIINHIVSEIAKSIPKRADFTKFTFTCQRTDRIFESSPGNFTASFELLDADCYGDVFYKSFSLADVLLPSSCNFHFYVYSNKVTPVTVIKKEAEINTGYNLLASYAFSDTTKNKNFTTIVDSLTFKYKEDAKQKFTDRIKLIDDYYLSDKTINDCFKQLRKFDFSNTDMIIVYDINLKEIEKTVDWLYNKNFPGILKLVTYDPISFIDRFNHLLDTIYQIRENLNKKIENLDKLYYDKGITELANKDFKKAKLMFERSVLFNPQFAPSQLQLAKILYNTDSILAAADKISFIFQNLNPDPEIHKEILLFADTLYNKMLSLGYEFINASKYNEAIEMFEKCVYFCNNAAPYPCTDSHIKGLALGRFGIYQSYLMVAQKAIDNNKLELAEAYINDARKYQKKYSEFIINDAEAINKYEKLMWAYIARGDTFNAQKNYLKALLSLQKAQQISEQYNFQLPQNFNISVSKSHQGIYKTLIKKSINQFKNGDAFSSENTLLEAIQYQKQYSEYVNISPTADSLMQKIKSAQITSLINSGIATLAQQNHKKALDDFTTAKSISKEFRLPLPRNIDSLITTCAVPLFFSQINYCLSILRPVNADSITIALDSLKNKISSYGIANDTSITNSINRAYKKALLQKCLHAKTQYDSIITQALKNQNNQQYIQSLNNYDYAITIAEKYPECTLSAFEALEGKRNVLYQANYQKLLENAQTFLSSGNYLHFLSEYSEAEIFYYNMQLKNYGISHKDISEILILTSDTTLLLTATDYFIQKSKPELALTALKQLKKFAYTSESTKYQQQQIAAIQAMKDFATNPLANPSIYIMAHTASDKWLKYFTASYLKTWKSLKKK